MGEGDGSMLGHINGGARGGSRRLGVVWVVLVEVVEVIVLVTVMLLCDLDLFRGFSLCSCCTCK